MLNEERVILMTKLASYEAGEGKENLKTGNYFRSDYIGWQVIKSVFCATIAFALMAALCFFYDFEVFMQEIYQMDLIGFAKKMLIYYVIVVGIYAAVSYFICVYKYNKARHNLRVYYQNLKKLNSLYDEN